MSDPGDRARVERALEAVFAPMALAAAMELDLFTALEDGPRDAADLAAAGGLDASRLDALLRALVVDGWLASDGERYATTPAASRWLVRGKPGSLAGTQELHLDLWGALLKTADSIRAGAPRAKHDFAAMDDEALAAFFRGLHPMTLAAAERMWQGCDLSGARRLLDVGGGSGAVAISACARWSELSATIAELPSVVPHARRFVAEAGLEGRVDVRAADVVGEPLEGQYDVAVLRAFLQVLSPDQCRAALRHVAAALRPGGELLIVARALDDDRLAPRESVHFDLVFLNLYDSGRAFTEAQHREWLAEAGFVDVEREPFPGGASLFRARRAGGPDPAAGRHGEALR